MRIGQSHGAAYRAVMPPPPPASALPGQAPDTVPGQAPDTVPPDQAPDANEVKRPEPPLTVAKIACVYEALVRLGDQALDFDTASKVLAARTCAQPHHARYLAAQAAAVEKYGTRLGAKLDIPQKNVPKFVQELNLVGAEAPADFNDLLERVQFPAARIASAVITPNELLSLQPLLR
jgi:hypothetical protein